MANCQGQGLRNAYPRMRLGKIQGVVVVLSTRLDKYRSWLCWSRVGVTVVLVSLGWQWLDFFIPDSMVKQEKWVECLLFNCCLPMWGSPCLGNDHSLIGEISLKKID